MLIVSTDQTQAYFHRKQYLDLGEITDEIVEGHADGNFFVPASICPPPDLEVPLRLRLIDQARECGANLLVGIEYKSLFDGFGGKIAAKAYALADFSLQHNSTNGYLLGKVVAPRIITPDNFKKINDGICFNLVARIEREFEGPQGLVAYDSQGRELRRGIGTEFHVQDLAVDYIVSPQAHCSSWEKLGKAYRIAGPKQ